MTTTTETSQNAMLAEAASLLREKLDTQDRTNEINKRLDELEEPLLEYFSEVDWEKPPRVRAQPPKTEPYELLRRALAVMTGQGDDLTLLSDIADFLAPKSVTVYVEEKLWAGTKEGSTSDQACIALQENGYEHLVHPTFNTNTLSAVARELARDGQTFPVAVLEHVSTSVTTKIRGRRSN